MPKKYLFLPLLVLIVLTAAGMPYMRRARSETPAAEVKTAAQETRPAESAEQGPIKGFTAFGETWRAVVSGDTADLEGEGITCGVYKTERSAYAKGVEFSGSAHGTDFTLNIRSQPCKDAAGNKYDLTAKLFYGKKTYKGVALPKAMERADT